LHETPATLREPQAQGLGTPRALNESVNSRWLELTLWASVLLLPGGVIALPALLALRRNQRRATPERD